MAREIVYPPPLRRPGEPDWLKDEGPEVLGIEAVSGDSWYVNDSFNFGVAKWSGTSRTTNTIETSLG